MNTLRLFPFAFALLIFSGCYTHLLIQDDPPTPAQAQPINAQPLPPTSDPVMILVSDPDAVYMPAPDPPYIQSGYSNPAPTAPPAASEQRTSGVQRSAPSTPQTPPQNTNRTSVPTRDGKK